MNTPPVPKRPLSTRVVQWGVLMLALWNLGRAVALWQQSRWLNDLPLTPDPRLRLALALGWAALFVTAFIAMRGRKSWSRLFIPFLLVLYGVYELGMIIVYTPTPPAFLPILIYVAFIGFAVWALWRHGRFPTLGRQGGR